MIFEAMSAPQFLSAIRKVRQQQLRLERQTRLAKQRARLILRKLREC